jgi:hypothetical protein
MPMFQMSPLAWALLVIAGVILVGLLAMTYLGIVLAWGDQKTQGLSYYGLSPAERERFAQSLKLHARLLHPFLRLLNRWTGFSMEKATFTWEGVAGPKGGCSPESFARAAAYVPRPEDVFVVTQMKCGTTWMQHVVYQIVHRGAGDLVETGRALYAVSPWLESTKSVSVEEAPVVGTARPTRVIKTHFPADRCPFDDRARYVYVARHPVSCFASCVDFLNGNLGVFTPDLPEIEAWFCSNELMWWGTWPTHVSGWWKRARDSDAVLFVTFEDMKRDLSAVVVRVADFLGVPPLDPAEMAAVVEKCGFSYMQRHSIAFEMHPPHLLSVDGKLFARGTLDRHADVERERSARILAWSAAELERTGDALASLYPAE